MDIQFFFDVQMFFGRLQLPSHVQKFFWTSQNIFRTTNKIVDRPKNFWTSKNKCCRSKNLTWSSKKNQRPKQFFGRLKMCLDDQKNGRLKMIWTTKSFLNVQKNFLDFHNLFWKSTKVFGRPTNGLGVQSIVFSEFQKNFWTSKATRTSKKFVVDVPKIF